MLGKSWQKVVSFRLNAQLAMARDFLVSSGVSMLPKVAVFSTLQRANTELFKTKPLFLTAECATEL